MREYSAQYKSTLGALSPEESPIILLEIEHSGLTEPVRVVNDSEDIVCNGNLFIACPFRCSLPDDFENQLPKATLSVDNIGRDLVYWIESSNGAVGATARFIQVMRSRPNLIEWEITMNLTGIRITQNEVSGTLGFEDFFTRPAIHMAYRPDNSAGLF